MDREGKGNREGANGNVATRIARPLLVPLPVVVPFYEGLVKSSGNALK